MEEKILSTTSFTYRIATKAVYHLPHVSQNLLGTGERTLGTPAAQHSPRSKANTKPAL